MAKLWSVPAAAAVAVTPEGSWTFAGVEALVVLPVPSWPKELFPHGYSSVAAALACVAAKTSTRLEAAKMDRAAAIGRKLPRRPPVSDVVRAVLPPIVRATRIARSSRLFDPQVEAQSHRPSTPPTRQSAPRSHRSVLF